MFNHNIVIKFNISIISIFINNICRWGNFNNIRILQNFPFPELENYTGNNHTDIYTYFHLTKDEIEYISKNI